MPCHEELQPGSQSESIVIFLTIYVMTCSYICTTDSRPILYFHLWSFVSPATVVLTGLEPNTTYEVRVAAVNGKGQGEFSHTETFQTLPIRKFDSLLSTSARFVRRALVYSLGSSSKRDLQHCSNSHWNPVIITLIHYYNGFIAVPLLIIGTS